jgi:rhodanese-related sulfurtransferase
MAADVIRRLQEQGYTRLYNMAGGVNAWARQIDPALPTY